MLKNRVIYVLLIVILLMGAWIIGREREISAPKVDHLYIFSVTNLEDGSEIKAFQMAFVTNDDHLTQVCAKPVVDNIVRVTTKDCGITTR